MKFCDDSLSGFQVIERTQFVTDRQTDRRTDTGGKTICLPTLKGFFFPVSDVSNQKFRVRLCTCNSEKNLGVLIGACALNRANTVSKIIP